MAIRKMRVDHTEANRVVWRDAVTGQEIVACDISHLVYPGTETGPMLEAVVRYGVTQIVQDGGAVDRDAPFSERLAGMRARIESIESGTYRLGQRGGMVDADVFAAMVALSMVVDFPDNRAKWRDAKKFQRDAIRRKPAIAQWIAENATDAEGATAAVESIFNS